MTKSSFSLNLKAHFSPYKAPHSILSCKNDINQIFYHYKSLTFTTRSFPAVILAFTCQFCKSCNLKTFFLLLGVLLYSILGEPKLRNAKICLVLTKMDYAYRQMRNEALLMLEIDKLKTQVPQKISIIEASAITREGLDKIVEFMFE